MQIVLYKVIQQAKGRAGTWHSTFTFHKPSSLPYWLSSRRPWNKQVPMWTMNKKNAGDSILCSVM